MSAHSKRPVPTVAQRRKSGRGISRRTLLRGAVGGSAVALALPWLEAMLPTRDVHAKATALEPIFGLFFWANGVPWHAKHGELQAQGNHPDLWTPAEEGLGFTPSQLMTPLGSHPFSVASGLEPKTEVPSDPPGQSDGHMRGFMVNLTGDRIKPEGFDHPSHTLTALRPSIDQYVANHEGFYGSFPTRFRSLEIGVSTARFHDYGHWNNISYNGPDSQNPAILSPTQLYNLLFNVPDDLVAVGRRARLLDAVMEDAGDLRLKLGTGDRDRLDAHLEHLSEIQRRLELTSGTCDSAPEVPGDSSDLLIKTDIMAELLAVALQCGLTRVFSFMLTSPATTHVFSNLGVNNDMHATCHAGEWEQVRAITDYQMQAFARLLDRFAATLDPMDDSLLDRACIFATSEYGEGWQHSVKEMPIIVAGRCNGNLNPHFHVREAGGNVSKVHVTMLRALGLETPSFGWNGGQTSDELPGLRNG